MKLGKNEFAKGQIYGEEFIKDSKKKREIGQDLVMATDGVLAKLSLEIFNEVCKKNYL